MKKLSELYAPKPPGEKAFVKKHQDMAPPEAKNSEPTKDDAVFKATNVKTFQRKVYRFGYDAPEDDKAFDSGPHPSPTDQNPAVSIAPYTIKTNEGEETTLRQYLQFLVETEQTDDEVVELLLNILDQIVIEPEPVTESEQIDELSPETLSNYANKAKDDKEKIGDRDYKNKAFQSPASRRIQMFHRNKGIHTAKEKLKDRDVGR